LAESVGATLGALSGLLVAVFIVRQAWQVGVWAAGLAVVVGAVVVFACMVGVSFGCSWAFDWMTRGRD
jgi:hypothetical protein